MRIIKFFLYSRLLYNVAAYQDSQRQLSQSISIVLSIILVLFSGFCSGATQGLMSLDQITLEIKLHYGNQIEKQQASRILPLVKQHHLLMLTLLVTNAICNETLPIVIHSFSQDWVAILTSTVLILIFGEILPSAIMTGPLQMPLCYRIIPMVNCLIAIFFFFCYPLSILLDYYLGTTSKRYQLSYIRQIFHDSRHKDILVPEELKIISSVMEMRAQQIQRRMIPLPKIFSVMPDEPFCKRLVDKIKIKGYTHVPVIEDSVIVGTFKVAHLLKRGAQDYGSYITDLVKLKAPLIVSPDTSMLELLRLLVNYKTTLAFVQDEELIGMITMNEVFEAIADDELRDQDDHGTMRNETQSSILQ